MAFANGGQIVTSGLVLALDAADRNSYVSGSTTWSDISGNGNTGTLTNGPTFDGGNGGSILFDGTNDYVQNSNTSFNYSNISISTWIRRDTTSTTFSVIISKESASTGWILHIINTNKIYWKINGSDATATTSLSSLTAGVWYYITSTYNGSQLAVYINSVLDNTSNNNSGIVSNSATIRIGEYQTTGNAFKGNIANIQIYNRALTTTEILQNYNATKTRFGL